MQNHYAAARQAFTQGLALGRDLGDRQWQAWVLHRLGWVAREQADTATAWAELRESEALFRALANEEGLAWVLTTMAELAVVEEDAATAAALLAESAARTTASSSQLRHAWNLNHLGHVAQLREDWAAAARWQEHSLAVFAALFGARNYGAAWAWEGLGWAALGQGRGAQAGRWLRQSLLVRQEMGDLSGVAWCLAGLACVAAVGGAAERAAQLWGAADGQRAALGVRGAPAARAIQARVLGAVEAEVGAARYRAWVGEGQALTREAAVAAGLEIAATAEAATERT